MMAENSTYLNAGGVTPKTATEIANAIPVANSTTGYRHGIRAPQWRHFARKRMKLRTGMLSYQAIVCSQKGQKDRAGFTTERSRGRRNTQTFRKLPISRPARNARAIAII